MNGVSGCKHEEAKLSAQTAAVKEQAGAGKTTLAYCCDVSNAMPFYDKQLSALSDPSNKGWFLRQPKARSRSDSVATGGTCSFESSPAWDFRNASARKYFAEVVVGQWASDPTVDSVFVDEADALVCYWAPTGPKSSGVALSLSLSLSLSLCVCVCVCVCVRARARARVRVWVGGCVRVRV